MKRFFRGILVFITVLTVSIYLLASLTPYISPVTFWPMTFLGLGFPPIALVYLVVLMVWLFINRKVWLVLLLLFILAGFTNLSSMLAFHYFSDFSYKKDTSALRVISWNVKYFDNNSKHADSPDSVRRKMINFLKKADADVLFLQEFREYTNSEGLYSNIQVLRDTLGYRYSYFTRDKTEVYTFGNAEDGVIIFSKLPIIDSGKLSFEEVQVGESIGYADILFRNRKLRLSTTHLLSMSLFREHEIQEEGKFINYNKAYFIGKSRYRPLRLFDSIHARQAVVTRKFLSESPYPIIFAGDLNSVPTSYVYHQIKGNLNDAFVEKGKWLGTSFQALSPTLRIDFILTDRSFKVKQFQTPKLYLSDHFPVIADIEWIDKK